MGGSRREKKRHLVRNIILCLFAALFLWVVIDLYLSNNVLKRQTVTLHNSRLPEAFDGFTVVHLSDLHEKEFGPDNRDLVAMVRDCEPDIIAITGDFIEDYNGIPYAETLCAQLVKIAPVYYVTGNHEWAGEFGVEEKGIPKLMGPLKDMFNRVGVAYLEGDYQVIFRGEQSIVIAGLDDPNARATAVKMPALAARIRSNIDDDPFILLLYHRYDDFETVAEQAIDVVLTGHAHGGIVRLPFTDGLVGPDREFWPKNTSGAHVSGRTTMIVSRGIGDTYFPRFNNRPNVIKLVLRSGG